MTRTELQRLRREILHDLLAVLDFDLYMSVDQLTGYLPVSRSYVEKNLEEIPHYRIGKKLLFRKSEIHKWMEMKRGSRLKTRLAEIADNFLLNVLDEEGEPGGGAYAL